MVTENDVVIGECKVSGADGQVNVQLIPERFRWLKRFLILGGCLLVGLACLRWWWGFEADRRLAAVIERYRLAGLPVYAGDIDSELDAVPEEENAAVLLEKAIFAVAGTTQSGVHYRNFLDEPKTFDEKMEAAEELIKSNAEALDLVRQARARSQVAWSQRLQDYTINFNTGLEAAQRSLARLLWFSASYHYRTGNHAEAIETMHDFLAFSEAINSHPTVISSLVGWACYGLAGSLLEDSVAGLRVDSTKREQEDGVCSATRAQIEGLIASLLREADTRRALVRSYNGDRLAFDLVRRQVEVLRLVADAAGPYARTG